MDIADEIEVATILEMQLSHCHFNSILFDNISLSTTAKKPAKHCAAHLEFWNLEFCLFSRFCCCCGCVELCSSPTRLNNS